MTVVLVVIGLAALGSSGSSPSKSHPSSGKANPPGPAAPAYLETLQAKEGDAPEPGEVQVGGRDLKHSIFWEEVGEPQSSTFCAGKYECRAVTYELEGRYQHFEALVGGRTSESQDRAYNAHWWVVLDGHVIQGSFNLNRPPVTVEVSVRGVQEMELRLTAEAQVTAPTLTWGNARVS